MVTINNFELPSSCSKCKFVKLIAPEKNGELPEITCLLTGNKIFDFIEDLRPDDAPRPYFDGRADDCLLEEKS